MKASVFVEQIGKKKYRAITSQPVPLESEGTTQEEAVDRLCALAKSRLASGHLIEMNLPGTSSFNPWQTFAGIWKDHPDFDAFVKNIAEHRRIMDKQDAPP